MPRSRPAVLLWTAAGHNKKAARTAGAFDACIPIIAFYAHITRGWNDVLMPIETRVSAGSRSVRLIDLLSGVIRFFVVTCVKLIDCRQNQKSSRLRLFHTCRRGITRPRAVRAVSNGL